MSNFLSPICNLCTQIVKKKKIKILKKTFPKASYSVKFNFTGHYLRAAKNDGLTEIKHAAKL